VRAAAKARLAEQAARKAAAKFITDAGPMEDPLGELLRVAAQMTAFKDYLAAQVEALNAEDWRYQSSQKLEQVNSLVTLLQSAMRDVARVIESMAKLDLEARRTRLQERDAGLVVEAVNSTFTRMGLSDDQRREATVIIVQELRAAESGQSHDRPVAAPLTRAR
jgi:hypothetical protein